ncbi:MAG TPA: hypothetical protein VJM69_06245 [Dehalococcoidia bacterium]|nr:hypothetical protein [Dehalococcoidia bacterium]
MGSLAMDERYILINEQAIQQGKPVAVQIREDELFTWQNVQAILSPQPFEGGVALEVLDLHGATKDRWFIRVLEEMDEEVNVEKGDYF